MNDIRSQFPLLQHVDDPPIVYLDSAATAQKPQSVLDAMWNYYAHDNANVKRGMHSLAERSTQHYEHARKRTAEFINAPHNHEIIFTKNCTEAINLVAKSWGTTSLSRGDVVLLSLLEHHSNIIPWMQLKDTIGIEIEWIEIDEEGTIDIAQATKILQQEKTKLLALTCISNVLGVRTPFEKLTKIAKEYDVTVLLDAAQLAPHAPIDVQKINCDFLTFSAHKIYGPTGIGVLYGKSKILNQMPPFLGGGSMIENVTTEGFTPTHIPDKFEAGTPPIVQAVGLSAAIDFLEGIGWDTITNHEQELLTYAFNKLSALPFIQTLGPKDPREIHGCMSFTIQKIHPHDLTEFCGQQGVCMRAGHHCAQPLHRALSIPASTRLSVGIYNTKEDINQVVAIIQKAYEFFLG